jgi:signal transduction histidine kinase
MFHFTRFSLARQFLLLSLLILLTGMLVIGAWVGRQVEIGVLNRTAGVTALYVDSFIAPHLQALGHSEQIPDEGLTSLESLLSNTPLGQKIVAFKVWSPDGAVLYSTSTELIGRRFPLTPALAQAFSGEVQTELSDLTEPENEVERLEWSRLIETYAPVRREGTSSVIAVSEFYQTTDELDREVRAARKGSWLVVGVATLAMYLLLAGLVGRASNIILSQQAELRQNVADLTRLLEQNEELNERVRRAGARTATLNERFLRRVAADLHDGPGQVLALALLRIDALAEACADCAVNLTQGRQVGDDFRTIRTALQSALGDMRMILSGLRLPALDALSPAEVVERAVGNYQRTSGRKVDVTLRDLPGQAPRPVKITMYRVLQESLANGFRHGAGAAQRVFVGNASDELTVEIADAGPGFDVASAASPDRLGLAGMRERVEILGGTLEIVSARGEGTTVRARLPMTLPVADDG